MQTSPNPEKFSCSIEFETAPCGKRLLKFSSVIGSKSIDTVEEVTADVTLAEAVISFCSGVIYGAEVGPEFLDAILGGGDAPPPPPDKQH